MEREKTCSVSLLMKINYGHAVIVNKVNTDIRITQLYSYCKKWLLELSQLEKY